MTVVMWWPDMVTRWWQVRWARALVVAAFVGAWPACSQPREVPSAGEPNLNFVLKDVDGKDVRLADFKGRPLLINIWATWCGPCKTEIPWFVEFAEKYKDKNLAVVGISYDDAPDEIRAFMAEYKISYTMLVGKGRDDVFAVYDPEGVFPYSWLIKPDGTIGAKSLGISPKSWFEHNINALF